MIKKKQACPVHTCNPREGLFNILNGISEHEQLWRLLTGPTPNLVLTLLPTEVNSKLIFQIGQANITKERENASFSGRKQLPAVSLSTLRSACDVGRAGDLEAQRLSSKSWL